MKPPILAISCLTLAWVSAFGQAADVPSFEVASVKPASPSARSITCSGGPGTTDPGTWNCSDVPLVFLITHAYGFQPPEFSLRDNCCQARFDVAAKVPAGTTREQFQRMQQNLLAERLGFTFHHEQKEMPLFELTMGERGSKLKESAPDAALAQEDPWAPPKYSIGKDGYPVFAAGHSGVGQGLDGRYRWTGFNLSMPELVKTLSYYLGRPVVDATGLKGKYDIDMTWAYDLALVMESAGLRDQIPEVPNNGTPGPTLVRAVQDQLGLKLNSKRGPGDIVVVDHVDKVPIEN